MSTGLILALDIPDRDEAARMAEKVREHVDVYKIGLSLFTRYGPDFVKQLTEKGLRVFLDLKLHDIPNTVAAAVRGATRLNVEMMTIHASGGKAMMEAAKEAAKEATTPPKLLGVTVLTSLDEKALRGEIGVKSSVEHHVGLLAGLARDSGMDGCVCSPHEIEIVKKAGGKAFLAVTPGIRPAATADDQKRVTTPRDAAKAGSDYIVVGRPILKADDPVKAAAAIKADLA